MSCCVCSSILATGKGKNQHKNLNGGHFDTGKAVLLKCIEESSGVSSDQIGLNSADSTVSYECCTKLENIAKLESKIEKLKEEILKNLSHFAANAEVIPQCSSTPHRRQQFSIFVLVKQLMH